MVTCLVYGDNCKRSCFGNSGLIQFCVKTTRAAPAFSTTRLCSGTCPARPFSG